MGPTAGEAPSERRCRITPRHMGGVREPEIPSPRVCAAGGVRVPWNVVTLRGRVARQAHHPPERTKHTAARPPRHAPPPVFRQMLCVFSALAAESFCGSSHPVARGQVRLGQRLPRPGMPLHQQLPELATRRWPHNTATAVSGANSRGTPPSQCRRYTRAGHAVDSGARPSLFQRKPRLQPRQLLSADNTPLAADILVNHAP
jgi:hypothetical protein